MARLNVKVVPGASRSRVAGAYGDGIKVQVAAAPEKGKANAAVIELLAKTLGVKATQVVLVSGPARPQKVFEVLGMEAGEMRRRLGVE